MRQQMLAMVSSAALVVATASVPAGAIQLPVGGGAAADANFIQVQGRDLPGGAGGGGGGRGGGPGGGGFSRGDGPGGGGGFSRGGGPGSGGLSRGDGPSVGDRGGAPAARSGREFTRDQRFTRGGDSRPRAAVRSGREFTRDQRFTRGGDSRPRAAVRDSDRRDFSRRGDFSRWAGNRPNIRHRGWSRDHRHRFFGAFLIGVPFGYAAVASHPCYEWFYGPQGWGYYWDYGRCPV